MKLEQTGDVMRTLQSAHLIVLASALACGVSLAAEPGDQAMLQFKLASASPAAADGSIDRKSVESRVRVAFNEKFASQQQGMRVELIAIDHTATADVTVAFYDARGESPVLVGTGTFDAADGGRNLMHMTGLDGTVYDVLVKYNRVQAASR